MLQYRPLVVNIDITAVWKILITTYKKYDARYQSKPMLYLSKLIECLTTVDPEGPPQDVTLEAMSSQSIKVTWKVCSRLFIKYIEFVSKTIFFYIIF